MAVGKIHVALTLVALALPAYAQSRDWQTITSLREVRTFGDYNGHLFAATSGGMLEITDPTVPGKIHDNINGFGTTNLYDFLVDQSGELWTIGLGHVARGIGATRQDYVIRDVDGSLIDLRSITDDGDDLWIGTDRGLIRFSKTVDGGQILDSYTLFGDLNPEPTINEIITVGTSIWIATSDGLATADRSNPILLKAPASWTSFNVAAYPELGSLNINRVVSFAGDIFVATDAGFFRLDIAGGTDTSFVAMPVGNNVTHADFVLQNDTLFCYYADDAGGGIAAFDGIQITSLSKAGLPRAPVTGYTFDGVRWVTLQSGGIYYNESGTYVKYPYTGAIGNNITGLVVDDSGIVYCGFGTDSAAYLKDSAWHTLPFWVRSGVNDVALDGVGGVYYGTEGDGWWRYLDGDLKKFDQTNSTLRGPSSDPFGAAFVIVKDAAFDAGWAFVLNREPYTDFPVAYVAIDQMDNPAAWDSLGPPDGFTDKFITSIDYFHSQLAVATQAAGIFFLQYFGTPGNYDSTVFVHYEQGFESNLLSNTVRVVRFDPSGVLWAGTNFGLDRYEFFEEGFVPVTLPSGIGPNVQALEFDNRGNAWVGCDNGLARIDATTGEATGYTTLNSDLVGDAINSIFYERSSGREFVATNRGISIIPSDIGTPTQRVDSVVAFPNPYIITDGTERLQFNYLESGRVSIHAVSGELIDDISVNDGWDGRNSAGRLVASGVYVWVLRAQDGEIARGKILLIRK